MESNMTLKQRNQVSKTIEDFKTKYATIDKEVIVEIKSILNTCEDKRLSFTDSGDADDDFSVTMPKDDDELIFLLVNEIKLVDDKIRVVLEDNSEWNIWEIGVSPMVVLSYMADELEMEYFNENEQ